MQEAAETGRDGFPYSNAVKEVDSSRARQADDSSVSMPQGSLSKVSPSRRQRRHRFRPVLAWRGADLTVTILRPADVHQTP